ncbi:MAG: F0F1 ATP synthase subunit B [Clostridia bacterium]|nr:F0F1 ATP synthase subunit B [Clostridia bacterium]
MQNLDIISINIWQMLISLCNLLIIFLIVKKFLFGPIKNVMSKRQSEIDEHYKTAEAAEADAMRAKEEFEYKLTTADKEAASILKEATVRADRRGEKIIEEAKEKADVIVRGAQAEAELERKKATEGIKQEIVDVSTCLSEKILEREIKQADHKKLIDSFISEIGEGNE